MNRSLHLHFSCSAHCLLVLATLLTSPARAEHTDASGATALPAAVQPPETVTVIGLRQNLASAQQRKRDKLEIVDSVLASDMQKLPDFNVSEALQRVTGIQIARDRGEGGSVTIRGLSQMETLLNGREIFTAGAGRNFEFADIPAELLSGIDVYKSASAEHLEGGIGGVIDMRTYRPFDFKQAVLVGQGRLIYGDLVKDSAPQFSLLASRRSILPDGGEFGALLNLSSQKRRWREDQKTTGNPVPRNDIVPGVLVSAPNGMTETGSEGRRERNAASLVLQWRPRPAIELYAEGSYTDFRTMQNTRQINLFAAPTFVAGSAELFAGTHDLKSITWTNAQVSVLGFARDTQDQTSMAAAGGVWRSDVGKLKLDLSYTKSLNKLFFSGPILAATAAEFAQDASGAVPGARITGTDLRQPANLRYTNLAYRTQAFSGNLPAAQLDGVFPIGSGLLDSLAAGLRYARRRANNLPGLIFADTAVTGKVADMPQYVTSFANGDFFPGSNSIRDYLVGDLASARDAGSLRNAFGIRAPIPSSASPLSTWKISETTQSAYVLGEFSAPTLPLDGKMGIRVVSTREAVSGGQSVPGTTATAPIHIQNNYSDLLPSISLRYQYAPGLLLRAAISRTLTRPDFNQLSPSLTLNPNPVNPAQNQGGAGNPQLAPVRAGNLDLAVEHYFGSANSAYATFFAKDVDGFVTTVSNPEVHNGALYQISRPQNSAAAHLRGLELGYQQFFDFLPGSLRGLGMQASYTHVDSRTANNLLGANIPLQNLSRHSANFIGLYEFGKVSARLAYNWRSKFLSGVTNIVGIGTLPIYTRAYGWLDASLRYRVGKDFSIALEGNNLSGTMRRSYYGVETRPQSIWANDRQVSINATLRF